eukprot:7595733-Pyramimonas_sp.AAC.1
MCTCIDFQSAVIEWGLASAFTNMQQENDLALIRKACPEKAPLLEKISAAGYLAQYLPRHLEVGGDDPRICMT